MATNRLSAEDIAQLDLETLVQLADSLDSYWTVFRFSSHWKCAFGTPELNPGPALDPETSDSAAYEQLMDMPYYSTLKEALVALIVSRPRF